MCKFSSKFPTCYIFFSILEIYFVLIFINNDCIMQGHYFKMYMLFLISFNHVSSQGLVYGVCICIIP